MDIEKRGSVDTVDVYNFLVKVKRVLSFKKNICDIVDGSNKMMEVNVVACTEEKTEKEAYSKNLTYKIRLLNHWLKNNKEKLCFPEEWNFVEIHFDDIEHLKEFAATLLEIVQKMEGDSNAII